ncbi:nucleotidyltransferase domain-containing protein [Ruegeria arenilitoris]|uniref:nucleotidyltransferase domain-containing protein n=1 Tax=Ruegeria arenilitoris TaxID=1173585 RepID=UPI00147E45DC|nr:nucleotidyltransferase domain-containing protein [Ruegeria arenilitoris]
MRDRIIRKLKEIERDEDIRILFAVESGSRAWGFHSPGSNYDVRFVYARPVQWHYRLDQVRDVVERPIDDELDLSGWELGKALKLAVGSNAVIGEWLQSPIRYLGDPEAVDLLTGFCAQALDRRSVTWHYLRLMSRQRSRLIGPCGHPRIKRYFYVLRPALALRWMRLQQQALPPMHMAGLMQGCDLNDATRAAIDHLVEQKISVKERAEIPNTDPLLDSLIDAEEQAAQDWLSTPAQRAHQDLWASASKLHLRLSGA